MFCNRCFVKMEYIMRFEPGKASKFYRCPKCHYESIHKRLCLDSLKITPLNEEHEQKHIKDKKPKKKKKNVKKNTKKGKKKRNV